MTRDWPNWGGFVKLWGLPLKSLICLLKTFIFTCKLTLGSVTGILSKKSFQALQLYIQISLSSGVIFWDKLRTLIWFLNYIRWYETTSLKVFSRLRLYYERCSFLNQWWKTKSKSSVCSSLSIKCKQSNDTKQLETKSSWKDKPETNPLPRHIWYCAEKYTVVLRQLIFGWLILQFPQS